MSMVLDLIRQRTSVRQFADKKIDIDIIKSILEAGRLSPSGGNEQSWMFGVITDKKRITDISVVAYAQKWIATAPLIIVLCTVSVDDKRGARDIQKARYPEYNYKIDALEKNLYDKLNAEEHQTKISGTQMALAALESGVYTTWVSYFRVDDLSRLLKLPSTIIPSEMLVMGYPRFTTKPLDKKSLQEIVFYNEFQGD